MLLKQWFIRTTKFAKPLLDGLNDPTLVDWKDIIKLQKHWLGDCSGYSFDLSLNTSDFGIKQITVWTENPEELITASFIAISKDHILNKRNSIESGLLPITVCNPFNNGQALPILVTNEVEFPSSCDTYLGCGTARETDAELIKTFNITNIKQSSFESPLETRENVLKTAKELNIGGYLVSSKLKDWLISRQRHWGTPIPIVHCPTCGPVPVKEQELPVLLPKLLNKEIQKTPCPSCGNANAERESDTMDTFVDSSWYFLRYLDPHNSKEMFDKNLATTGMPVDLYIGGKEHAVLHLYYARFVNHFLHSIGLVPQPEPFKRLLVQGMVMGRSFRVKGSGKYLKEGEVKILNAKKNQAEELETGNPVVMQWEKMSKSKLNGTVTIEQIPRGRRPLSTAHQCARAGPAW